MRSVWPCGRRATADLVGGDSISGADGNKSSVGWGGWDIWLLRLDANGNKLWDKTYGGSNSEGLGSLEPTRDGGFILAGGSFSGADGNKTSPLWGDGDVWIVRVDANGDKLWDKSYGGSDYEGWIRASMTSDGGLIVASTSLSGADGTKTSPNFGSYDLWVLRLDENGNELWQQGFGGRWEDYAQGIQPTLDGGFIIGSMSSSPPSGNKTSPNYGSYDFWVIRLGMQGHKVWEASFGSAEYDDLWALDQTSDGGFVLAGRSVRYPWLIHLAPEAHDCDGDGVPNAIDLCPDTPSGWVVNSSGCSVEQACPCEGPWKNHQEYVKCVREQTATLLSEGTIDKKERRLIMRQADDANCGRR
jgi:hypothetical protein